MNILVTGGTGFIGKHLVKQLALENNVICFVRNESKQKDLALLKSYGAKLFFGNIFNQEDLKKAMKNIQAVFHLAGGGYVATTFKQGFEELKRTNIETTKNVILAAVESKVEKFVHFSSVSAMGIIVEKRLDEHTLCKPKTPHELLKLETEMIMVLFKDKILITIIRPGIVYGPYAMNSEILQLSKLLKKGFFPIPGNGKNIMPWIYVDDVINGTLLAFNKNNKSCKKFILVSDPQPTFNQLIYSIKNALKTPSFIIHFPAFSFRFLGYSLEKLGNLFNFAPLINSVRAKSMTSNRIYDITNIKNLGYVQNSNFKESIKLTVNWYIENGFI